MEFSVSRQDLSSHLPPHLDYGTSNMILTFYRHNCICSWLSIRFDCWQSASVSEASVTSQGFWFPRFLNWNVERMHESARNGELCCRKHVWSQSCWYTRVLISLGWRQCFSARKIHLLPWRCCPPVSDFIACIFWLGLLDYLLIPFIGPASFWINRVAAPHFYGIFFCKKWK